ncbi:glycerol-3-phosphate dehydrogenase (NAD) [Methanobrevibacter ruminantium M1]|uniref:Glycerol-3-phosphate dehydrogenase [NAD(P)+] n=1 Tax=Methanobrevibacter ruminantium (strain ATCC 35063 / DSM 1093 / JCM 13430 / OCM 146 / M1) TaxID=634498 RepID=D3E1F3_METRM|nr:NAD(P)H-dependent glycerol-3-phosphate dehydrogenase [Methanobrevibacter ruminantium]ADC48038.1 glycerol-3-phosphate dehydrogenase (NAD) [Methanobrevibacter ruminantium M1]
MDKVGIIGAGSLGTALAQTVANNVDTVYLHLRREELAKTINSTGYNSEYYPNTKLKNNIIATTDMNDLIDCKIIFLSIPSSAFRSTLENLKEVISEDTILVTTAKGIEYPSLKSMGRLIEEYFDENFVALSGPNFASEIVLNLATVSNIASRSSENAIKVKKVLSTPEFKVKIIDDVVGLEICGVIKNINAIANGICEGMNINENARYAVLTKGFEDTGRIIEAFGGKISTASEYCGFGDLVLTSTSSESRNHTLGMLYGQRIIVDEKASGIVFEGKNSIMAIKDICNNTNTNSVVVNFVYDVIVKQIPPKIAFKDLWNNIEE